MSNETVHLMDHLGEYDSPKVQHWPKHSLLIEARLAMNLIEKWGMICGEHDGEDSAGRAKVTFCPAEKVVERACKMTELAFAAFRERGWLHENPDFEEAQAELKRRREEREAEKERAREARRASQPVQSDD